MCGRAPMCSTSIAIDHPPGRIYTLTAHIAIAATIAIIATIALIAHIAHIATAATTAITANHRNHRNHRNCRHCRTCRNLQHYRKCPICTSCPLTQLPHTIAIATHGHNCVIATMACAAIPTQPS